MAGRNPARYLAPIALIATMAGIYLVVHSSLHSKSKSTHSPSTATATHTRPRGRFARAKFYTVQANDTLTSISSRTGVSLTALRALNPHIDPNALQTGQKLRLRR